MAFSTIPRPTGRSLEKISGGAGAAKRTKSGPETLAVLKRLVDRHPEVQLATLVDKAPAGEEWVHEIKFDGYRLLGFAAGGLVRQRTRNGNDWTQSFPSIVTAFQELKVDSAVIDMERSFSILKARAVSRRCRRRSAKADVRNES